MTKQLFPAGLAVELPKMDLEMTVHHFQNWSLESEQMQKGRFSATIRTIHTPRIQLHDVDYSHGFFTRGSFPKECVMIGFVQTMANVTYQNRVLAFNELLITAEADEIDYISRSRNSVFTLAVEKTLFKQAFFAYFGEDFDTLQQESHFFLEAHETELFPERIKAWMTVLKENQHLLFMEDIYPRIEVQILKEIFHALRLDPVEKGRCKFNAKKARDFLHDNLYTSVDSARLAEELQISERQVERAFKMLYGITPKRYFLNLRMNAVRKALLTADAQSTTVSDIALKYNFFDLNNFSKAYKLFFAELPSQTLKGP